MVGKNEKMGTYQDIKYSEPPIVEVICEFRFVPGEPWDPTVPGLIYERLKDIFPLRRSRRRIQSEARAEAQGVHQEIQVTELAQFLREDEIAFVQIGPNLLSVNHLKPYPTWETFRPLIERGVDAYVNVAAPRAIRRIELRYISRIEIPQEVVDLSEYFSFRPFVGPQLPQKLSGFVVGIQSDYDKGRDTLRLQLNSTETDSSEVSHYLLDLDYFLAQPESVSPENAFEWIEEAHVRLQVAFEACLTSELRELFGREE